MNLDDRVDALDVIDNLEKIRWRVVDVEIRQARITRHIVKTVDLRA